ncbi:1-phosphofructokinase family hexose kinase [Microcella daejeonensis]|uniref:1-phosphofructokinase family hexose kinase n=1 Tax=Microcella daejeonensis TaxID=2994971 RepID=A0A9E8MPJ2_9MICO|nr:1-phosphofructokinase family hexose kinase [Microcella daejeonensis]WAB82486.1 1-phosphofructokinase family hexose kinase [Microcella daejeonensis]
MTSAPPIVTLTLNPALDLSTATERVVPEHKLRCSAGRTDAGGGGINVSRVIGRLGGRTLAVYAVGGPTGEALRRLVDAERMPGLAIPIEGPTRQNVTVDESSTGRQFRFVLPGAPMTEAEWSACLDAAASAVVEGGYLVASGSLAPGIPTDVYARLARSMREQGVRLVVDASGPALAEGVHLVKPSGRELGELVGRELPDREAKVRAAQELVARGSAQNVALTLGGDGAVLVTAEGVVEQSVPPVEVRSTVGAGDSFLAAMVLRMAQGRPLLEAFRAGVAAGTATAMSEGTGLCTRVDVERLERQLAG